MNRTFEVPPASFSSFGSRLPEEGTVDVTIEVVAESMGDQVEAERLPWHSLIYDESGQVLEISVGGRDHQPVVLRHEIHFPARIWAEEVDGVIHSISVEAEKGARTIVRFHQRPALGAG